MTPNEPSPEERAMMAARRQATIKRFRSLRRRRRIGVGIASIAAVAAAVAVPLTLESAPHKTSQVIMSSPTTAKPATTTSSSILEGVSATSTTPSTMAPSTTISPSAITTATPAKVGPACLMPGWRQVPNNSAPDDSFLSSVAAISADDAWAVGNIPTTAGSGPYPSTTVRPGGPLVEHWNGSSWAVVATAASTGNLNAVGADSPDDVWAVGSVIEHFDGHTWSLASTPFSNTTFTFNAVAVIAPTDVWAVGQQADGQLLAENWNGRKWTAGSVPDPNPGAAETFTGIAATSADDIWAVGNVNQPAASSGPPARYPSSTTTSTTAAHPDGPFGGLIEHWNGSSWSVSTVLQGGDLNAVSADAPNDAWAVGANLSDIAHWNGHRWTVAANVASGSTGSAQLYGVTALSPSDAWAVGDTSTNKAAQLIEHWDGKAWVAVPSPDPPPISGLTAVAADNAHQIWAVGNLGWIPGTPPQVGAIIDRLCSG